MELELNQKEVDYVEWACRKCGLMRCNKETHKHGIPKTLTREHFYGEKYAKKNKQD